MNEGSDERRRGNVGKRVAVLLLGMALLSGGLWGWQRSRRPVVTHEVVWLLESGKLHGRVDPDIEIQVGINPMAAGVKVTRPFSRNWLGFQKPHSEQMGMADLSWGKVMEPAWAMLDEQDRVYLGIGTGQIYGGDAKEVGDWKIVTGAERARVVAMYLQQMGRAWPEPQEQAR